MTSTLAVLITILILISCFFDLKTRKIPNAFNAAVFFICACVGFYYYGYDALSSFFIVSFCLLPLYFLGIFGGGDYKLFAAVSFAIPIKMHFEILLFAAIWAAVYGAIKILTYTDYKNISLSLYLNFRSLFSKTKSNISRIPLTIPYLLAWLGILRFGGIV
tara:strand:+ start:5258 stop:5740 length:483 start_codon:yes stop_codon:yes gene_type:complete